MIVAKYELSDDVVTALCVTYGHADDDGMTAEEFAEHQVKSYLREVYESWAAHQVIKVAEVTAREQAKTDAVLAVKVLDDKGEAKPEPVKPDPKSEVAVGEVVPDGKVK